MLRFLSIAGFVGLGCSRPTTRTASTEMADTSERGGDEGSDGSLDTQVSGDGGSESSDDGGAGSGTSGDESSGEGGDSSESDGQSDDGGSGDAGGDEGVVDTDSGEVLDTAAPSGGPLDGSYCGTWEATIDMSGWVDTYSACTCEIYVSGEELSGIFDPCYSASAGIEFYGDVQGTVDPSSGDGTGTFYMGGTPYLDFESTISDGVLEGVLSGSLSDGSGYSAIVEGGWTTTRIEAKSCP